MLLSVCYPADIPRLESLLNLSFRGDFARKGWTHESDLLQGGVRTTRAELKALMDKPGVTFLKYTDSAGVIQGCVSLQIRPTGLYFGMLAVNPEYQGKGIGKQFLKAAEEHARTHGCSNIFMSVISARNELIDWYLRHGYRDTGKLKPLTLDPANGIPARPLYFCILRKNLT